MPEILAENRMIMRITQGSATFKDDEGAEQEAELYTTVHGSPVIKFADGTTVYWDWQELLEIAWKRAKEKPTDGNQ